MTASKSFPKIETRNNPTKIAASQEQTDTWSDEERAAMHEHVKEIKAVGRGKSSADAEIDVLAKNKDQMVRLVEGPWPVTVY